jgi:hypothetical protein
MPPQPTATQTRLKNVTTCLTITADTLEMLASDLKIPLLEPICNTTQSLLKSIEVTRPINLWWGAILTLSFQTVKQNKSDCADLMEKTHNLLNAIIMVYIKSDTGADLPPLMLKHIGRFTVYLNL